MKKIVQLILLMFLTQTTVIAQSDSLKLYYENIIEAENLLISDNLERSSSYFLKAFQYKDIPFRRDIKNAILVESYSMGRTEILEKLFLKYLFVSGWTYTDFFDKNDKAIYPHIFPEKLFKLIDLLSLKSKSEKQKLVVDYEIVSIIEEIYNTDQSVRDSCMNKYGFNYYESPCLGKIKEVDLSNYNQIKALIMQKRIDEPAMMAKNCHAFNLSLEHNFCWSRDSILLLIEQKVFEGVFDARVFCSLLDVNSSTLVENTVFKDKRFGTDMGGVYGKYYFIYLDGSVIEKKINKNRKDYFLDSYISEQKRNAWYSKVENKMFSAPYSIANISSDSSIGDKLLKKGSNKTIIIKR